MPKEKQDELKPKRECGSNEDPPPTPASARFNMEVRDRQGNIVHIQDLPKSLSITSFVQLDRSRFSTSQLNDLCFAYSTQVNDDWKCLTDSELTNTKNKNVYVITATTDHLTSFAAFLNFGGDGSSSFDCHKPYYIASSVMLGSFALIGVVFAVLSTKLSVLKKLVYGYRARGKSIEEVEQELAQRMAR